MPKNKTKIKFTVSYDGTDFCGWQRQNHEQKPSLCQTIQEALEKVFKHPIELYASGRTDAGVHALNQVCHFTTTRQFPMDKRWDLGWALKSKLPSTVVIKKAWIVPDEFHATLSAQKKTYRYLVHNAKHPSVFLRRYTENVRHPLDLEHLKKSSQFLLGQQDFKSFQSVGSDVPHTVREILQADWCWRRPGIAQFTITGTGFLKQMVRNIVGTQLFLERKELSPDEMKKIIAACDRQAAAAPAAANGLFLMRVYYPQDLDNRCREL